MAERLRAAGAIISGFSPEGLPIGVQLTGRPFGEGSLFRLARAYEARHSFAAIVPRIGGA